VLASARALGATVAMPARVGQVVIDTSGAQVSYVQGDARIAASTHAVVNAAGPWLNRVLALVTPSQPPADVELVRGTHIELSGRNLDAVYYLEAPQDGRAVLVMPRQDHTLVGTTERAHADPDAVAPADDEVDYLLDVVRARFPGWASAGGLDVRAAWSGLRVLPRARSAAFRRSRETVLVADRERRPRLLTICGGKLTSYRATAEHVLRRLAPTLPRRAPQADTRELGLEPA
jgi:glycerol-3-phosphate dehydrogenase